MLNLYQYYQYPEKLIQGTSSDNGLSMGKVLGKEIIIAPASTEKYLTYADAVKYAESTKGWRLPTMMELVHIYNYISKTFHDSRYHFGDKAYWSSTLGDDNGMVWIKNMQNGGQLDYYADGKARVRLVKK